MHPCCADTRRISKNYYNDLHQDDAVVKYRSEHIDEREGLYGRMAVWELLDKAEEDTFMARAADLPMCELINPGKGWRVLHAPHRRLLEQAERRRLAPRLHTVGGSGRGLQVRQHAREVQVQV